MTWNKLQFRKRNLGNREFDKSEFELLMFGSANLIEATDIVRGADETSAAGLFSGLVVIARAKHPIPSRTRPLSAVAPMVLRLKTWESRSPPNLKRDTSLDNDPTIPIAAKALGNGRGVEQPGSSSGS